LLAAVSTDAAYHAFVGSRRKMAALRDKLIGEGIAEAALDRIKARPDLTSVPSPRKKSRCRFWRRSRPCAAEDSAFHLLRQPVEEFRSCR
jgi:hypothetical protein